jgi:hypothetical protein
MRFPSTLALLLFLVASPLWAHVDDSGDIHPFVKVEGEQFAIYFYNSESESKLKTTLGKDKKVIKDRESVSAFPAESLPIELPEEQTGVNVPQADAFYVIPQWHRKHQGKPFILRLKDHQKARISLEWHDLEIDEVHGADFGDSYYIMVASKVIPEEQEPWDPYPFYFFAFSRESGKISKAVSIGDPIRIYEFPCASEVVFSGGHAYISWMGQGPKKNTVLNLSKFDPSTGRITTKTISDGHGNASPSIGIIGDQIVVAFHRPTNLTSYFGSGAKIVRKHLSLKTVFADNRAQVQERSATGETK